MLKKSCNIFVYGTLKSGFYNHRCLGASPYIGEAKTVNTYIMKDLGAYPGLLLPDVTEKGTSITGEVYKVTFECLEDSLDRLEGYPRFYNRHKTAVALTDGTIISAWIYFLKDKAYYFNKATIESGVWK